MPIGSRSALRVQSNVSPKKSTETALGSIRLAGKAVGTEAWPRLPGVPDEVTWRTSPRNKLRFQSLPSDKRVDEGEVQPERGFKFAELFLTGKCYRLRNGV